MKVARCLYCNGSRLTYVTHRSDNNGILRCERCRVMMVENISDDTESLYTSDYFEKKEDTKSGYTDYLSSPAANLMGKYGFTRLFARQPGRHLDLGCADGSLIEIFKAEGYDSTGLEISRDAVKIAQTKGLDVSFSRLHSFPTDIQKSDVITAFDLLEHADKPGAVLNQVYANLQENGYFVFSTLSVQNNDPSDYWFNNSLEHYVYYNHESLTNILSEVFGAANFAFVEIEINGVAEFWGFAKKGNLHTEAKYIDNIATGGFDKNDADGSFLVCLFYNQLSKFSESAAIISYFEKKWEITRFIQAKFYNYYFQGRYQDILNELDSQSYLVGSQKSVYWQAVAFVKDQFSKIRETDVSSEYNKEIVNLREQLFRTKDELQSIKNSRVLGRLIKIRNRAGATLNRSKGVSGIPLYVGKRAFNKTRKVIAPLFPENTRNSIKKTYRTVVQRGTVGFEKHVRFTDIPNPTFDDNVPLVSVVIPYYNRADTIDETIRSLKDQSYKNFDVVIINDGSTDAVSIKKLKKLNFDFLKAKVINQDNKGVAAARNTGIAQASGKYIICLDSDDILVPTFIEKAVIILETRPDVSVVSSHMNIFGVINEVHKNNPYDPLALMTDNMVITAAAFRKAAWSETTGYKAGIGYEDWEFWITLSQLGHWGTVIPEALFTYRTSLQSRYVEDKDIHWNNLKTIRSLHPKYKKQIRRLLSERLGEKIRVVPETGFINIANPSSYNVKDNTKINVLITMPWMTFGGAETLVYNYCREITETCNISFVTGLQSEHEWEYKFKYVSPHIYHLINLFEDDRLRLEFVSNYIKTRQIQVLHIVHNGFMFSMLPELKDRHPTLKVIVTLFNDRVPEYVSGSVKYQRYIDQYVSDNSRVETSLRSKLDKNVNVTVIPNGVNAYDEFNPAKFDREKERTNLKLSKEQISIFYIGRFSEEKNPDIFVQVARHFAELHNKKVTFFMIGDGPMRPEIEQMIQANNNSAQVIDLGYQVDVARYLSAADILVLPSSVEGFPLSILEAMAMEAAVIASDVGAVSDVVENGKDGFVVSPGSVLEIAQVIEALASDQKKLYSIKKNGRKKVENKYSNRVLSHNYKQLYKRLIQ